MPTDELPLCLGAHRVKTSKETTAAMRSVCQGRVRWEPVRSLWFTGMALGAVVGGALTFSWAAFAVFVVATVLVLLLGWLQYKFWFGVGSSGQVVALEQQVAAQKRENAGLQERNDALAAEVEDLKSGESAVEERARSELGMIKPGETFYRVVEPAKAGAPRVEQAQDAAAPEPRP